MIDTYGELKTEVADWLDREDLTTRIPKFIRLAETEIYRDLRCRENEFVVTYSSTGWTINGQSSNPDTNDPYLVLPPNYKAMKEVTWGDRPLEEISPQQLDMRISTRCDFQPYAFAIDGRDIAFTQALAEDQTTWGTTELIYTYWGTESLDALPTWQVGSNPVETPPVEDTNPEDNSQSDSNTTRLLQVAPDLYLHGAMYFAHLFLKSPEAQLWGGLFNNALASLKKESRLSTFTGSTVAVTSGR